MENIAQYKEIVRNMLQKIGKEGEKDDDPIKNQFIQDDKNGHYLLFSTGWKGQKRFYGCYLHIDITEDGKIWIQHDGTELAVANLLMDKGIPAEKIVLGFHPPIMRKDTDFATA